MSPRSLVAVASLSLAALLSLAGCAGQRPLYLLRADAMQCMKDGNYQAAEPDLKFYVEQRRDDYKTRFEYARCLLKLNRPTEARTHFAICADAEPQNDMYWDWLAQSMYEGGERASLTTFLEQRARGRGDVADWLRLAKFCQMQGNPDEAEQALLTAAKVDAGRSPSVQKTLADFYAGIGDRVNQVRRLRMAYYLDPKCQDYIDEIRRMGEIPGPSFGLAPAEASPVIADVPGGQ